MIRKIIIRLVNIARIIKINRQCKCKVSLKSFVDRYSCFEGRNIISNKASILETKVGFATYIGSRSLFSKTQIGRYCSIGANVKIIAGNHPTQNHISTHPIFYTHKKFVGLVYDNNSNFEEYTYTDKEKRFLCTIGNDVWIGEDVKIINGVSIGDGAIIATGAVVTKNVPPYAIVGGVPAKVIKYRFEEDDIDYLIKVSWWNKDIEWIKEHSISFEDINKMKSIT